MGLGGLRAAQSVEASFVVTSSGLNRSSQLAQLVTLHPKLASVLDCLRENLNVRMIIWQHLRRGQSGAITSCFGSEQGAYRYNLNWALQHR